MKNNTLKQPADDYHSELMRLHRLFARSKYGKVLAGRTRFAAYQPPHVGDADWIKLLGPDVDNLEHLLVTYQTAVKFSESLKSANSPINLNPDEEELLLLTALIHDWAEAVIGDINYNIKTDDDLASELKYLVQICTELDVATDRLDGVVSILRDERTRLGEIFNIVERIGYLSTASRAYSKILVTNDPLILERLIELCVSVAHNNVETMCMHAQKYQYVNEFLNSQAGFLDDICSCMLDDAQHLRSAIRSLGRN